MKYQTWVVLYTCFQTLAILALLEAPIAEVDVLVGFASFSTRSFRGFFGAQLFAAYYVAPSFAKGRKQGLR